MTPEFAELRRLAEAATPGPWEWDDDHARPGLRHGRSFGGVLFRCGALYGPDAGDAAYIAAANPAAVLGLLDALDERDALAAKVERVRTVGDITARHVGRQVQIGGWFEGALRELSAGDQPDEVGLTVLGDGEIRYGSIPLDTPCELLP